MVFVVHVDDILKKAQSDPELLQMMMDPVVMQALGEISADGRAFLRYKDNPKVISAFQKFGNMVGVSSVNVE